MQAVERARHDIVAGRWWKARDRLLGAVVTADDDEVLGLLGEVQFAMRDLPAAGAAWYPTGRTGEDARAAEAAWRERHGDDPVQLWLSLPGAARHRPDEPCQTLRDSASGRSPRALPGLPEPSTTMADGEPSWALLAVAVVAVVVIWCLACLGVGAWTIAQWLLP